MPDELETLRARCARLRAALAGLCSPDNPKDADSVEMIAAMIESMREMPLPDSEKRPLIEALEVLRETAGEVKPC